MDNKYIYNTKVTGNEIGFDGKMNIVNVMTMFQLVCGIHTYRAGVDLESVQKKYGAKWVITDIHFEIERMPHNAESVTIETWPLKPKAIRFPRIFVLKGEDGRDAVKAYSNWCLLDVKTDEIQRSALIGDPFGQYITDCPVDFRTKDKPIEFDECDMHHTHTVRMSDIDMNRHVNNISYIRMAMDCFTSEELESSSISSCNIYYKAQAYEGDNITLYRKSAEGKTYVEARSDEHVVFRLVMEGK